MAEMITKVRICRFKRFDDETFDLSGDSVVLAGPNNSGKSTLLHAISAWNLALRRWMLDTGGKTGRVKRIGVTLDEFTAVPLREMNLLWLNRHTARSVLGARTPKAAPLYIQLFAGAESLTIEFLYANSKLIYIRPVQSPEIPEPLPRLPDFATRIVVVHVPPFSGLGTQEPRHTEGMQNKLIGEGKAGDVIRNLVLEIWNQSGHRVDAAPWNGFAANIRTLFQYDLLPPEFVEARQAYIVSEYRPPQGSGTQRPPALDIANAGSGFHQVLLLLSFLYARPSAVLLLDEPDAHLHFILQREIFDLLRSTAAGRGCKLVVATHSEVILNTVDPEEIISFLGDRSHRLLTAHQKRALTDSLRRLTSLDLVQAQQVGAVLYVEDESDSKLLRSWARTLDHPAKKFLEFAFIVPLRGKGNLSEGKQHFQCLRLALPTIRGLCILDRDRDEKAQTEASPEGLSIRRWGRYESENYLINPELLRRFVDESIDLFSHVQTKESRQVVEEQFAANFPAAIDWLGEARPLKYEKGSELLVEILARTHRPLGKRDLYMLAEKQFVAEIHPDVVAMLDSIAALMPSVVPALAANESAPDECGAEASEDTLTDLDETDS